MKFFKYFFLPILVITHTHLLCMHKRKEAPFEQPSTKIAKTVSTAQSSFPSRYLTTMINCHEYLGSQPTGGYFALKFNRQEDCMEVALWEEVSHNCYLQGYQDSETILHHSFYVPLCTLQPTLNIPFKANRNHRSMIYSPYTQDCVYSDYKIGLDASSLVAGYNEITHEINTYCAHSKKYLSPLLYPIKTLGTLPDATANVRALLYGQKHGHIALMLDNNMLIIFISHLLVNIEKLADLKYSFK